MCVYRMCTTRLIQCTDVKRLRFGVNKSNDIESIIKMKKKNIKKLFFFIRCLACLSTNESTCFCSFLWLERRCSTTKENIGGFVGSCRAV